MMNNCNNTLMLVMYCVGKCICPTHVCDKQYKIMCELILVQTACSIVLIHAVFFKFIDLLDFITVFSIVLMHAVIDGIWL